MGFGFKDKIDIRGGDGDSEDGEEQEDEEPYVRTRKRRDLDDVVFNKWGGKDRGA